MSDETVDACPECDTTAGIYRRHGSKPDGDHTDKPPAWVCRACGAEFETPNTRERKHQQDTRGGLAGRLANASPEDVGP